MYIRNIRNIPDITCQEWMYLVQISVNSCHPPDCFESAQSI